jgi:hypothetical protein
MLFPWALLLLWLVGFPPYAAQQWRAVAVAPFLGAVHAVLAALKLKFVIRLRGVGT